jgi:hypothetical protein
MDTPQDRFTAFISAVHTLRRIVYGALMRLFVTRVMVLLALAIAGIAIGHASPMISGLFALNASDQGFVSLLVTLIAVEIFVQTRMVTLYAPVRLQNDVELRRLAYRGGSVGTILWTLGLAWVPWALFEYQLLSLDGASLLRIAGGAVLGLAVFLACVAIENVLSLPNSPQVVPIPFLRDRERKPGLWTEVADGVSDLFSLVISFFDGDGAGFTRDARMLPGHLLAALSTITLALFYLGAWYAGDFPGSHEGPGYVKAILYALLTLALYGAGLGFLCFFFDRYRVPVITLIAAAGFVYSLLPRNSHYYELLPTGNPAGLSASALWAGSNRQVIVVSAQGGGIQAAAWTTRVLAGIVESLPARLQPEFVRSVRLLSGVSGGSTGVMLYQTLYGNPETVSAPLAQLRKIQTAGVCSTALSWIGFGLTYYDFDRPLLPFLFYTLQDRGWGAEQAWELMLTQGLGAPPKQTMEQLRRDVAKGTRPLLVFNATVADLGVPLEIANFDLQPDPNNGFEVFRDLYERGDLLLTTAVRLSASFPYVSPSPRPYRNGKPLEEKAYAVTDGGLYDNFGVAGTYFTLLQATHNFTDAGTKPVIWIQIRLPEAPGTSAQPLARTALGPLLALNNTRDTGQRSRADQLTELAHDRFKGKLQINKFDYPNPNAPLSWALTGKEIRAIDDGWNHLTMGHEQIRNVCLAIGGTQPECDAAANPWPQGEGGERAPRLQSNFDRAVCPQDF